MARRNEWLSLLLIVLVGTAGWAVYQLFNKIIQDFLVLLGVTSEYAQLGIVLGLVIVVLIVVGRMSVKGAGKRIIGR